MASHAGLSEKAICQAIQVRRHVAAPLLRELLKAGLLSTSTERRPGKGRPATIYSLAPDHVDDWPQAATRMATSSVWTLSTQ